MSTGRVSQTIFAGDTQGRLGNCLQAAVASLLALPLEAVPHFVQSPADWVEDMVEFARAHGYKLVWRSGGEQTRFGLAFGPTVRSADITHAITIRYGEIWDPHPSRAGLTSVTTFIDWVPLTAVSALEVVQRAGITYRQFDYWCRCGWLRPLNPDPGEGARREFTPAEADLAARMGALVAAGVRPDVASRITRGDISAVQRLLAAVETIPGSIPDDHGDQRGDC